MKRSPLRSRPKRRPAMAAARAQCASRAEYQCEAGTPACPLGPHRGEHAHHRLLRSQGGQDEVTNLLWVCAAAHEHIHLNPAESYHRGWMIRRSAT